MKIKVKSQLDKVDESLSWIDQDSASIRTTLLAFGFRLEKGVKADRRGHEYDYYKVIGDNKEDERPHVDMEDSTIEQLLALADKCCVELIYGAGEWTLFNDPYYYT